MGKQTKIKAIFNYENKYSDSSKPNCEYYDTILCLDLINKEYSFHYSEKGMTSIAQVNGEEINIKINWTDENTDFESLGDSINSKISKVLTEIENVEELDLGFYQAEISEIIHEEIY